MYIYYSCVLEGGTPKNVLQVLINFYNSLLYVFCKKMARYHRAVSNHLLCVYHTLSAIAAVEAAVAAAVAVAQQQQQQPEQYTAAAVHICRATYLSWRRAGCRQGCILRQNMPCSLAWHAVLARKIRNNTIMLSNGPRTPNFSAGRNCEQVRDVWLASSGAVVAAWNRVRVVNGRRGPGLLDFKGSGLPISVATWPASAERGWLGMGRLVSP